VSGLHPLRLLRRVAVLPIVVYRRWISPWTPPSCRFRPTCSEYGARALLVHGLLKGPLLAAWRILRCHPFCAGGHDPVPGRGRWPARRRRAGPGPPAPVPDGEGEGDGAS
jgi:putative membrane protein insertion efficiency factor